jgi:hypothetical protein
MGGDPSGAKLMLNREFQPKLSDYTISSLERILHLVFFTLKVFLRGSVSCVKILAPLAEE